jgi:hypothetical protein
MNDFQPPEDNDAGEKEKSIVPNFLLKQASRFEALNKQGDIAKGIKLIAVMHLCLLAVAFLTYAPDLLKALGKGTLISGILMGTAMCIELLAVVQLLYGILH